MKFERSPLQPIVRHGFVDSVERSASSSISLEDSVQNVALLCLLDHNPRLHLAGTRPDNGPKNNPTGARRIAMQMVRAAGIPVPKVLSCGKHVTPHLMREVSILMTRLPGFTLENSRDPLEVDDEDPWLEEIKTCVHAIREWESPSQETIYSPIGTALCSSRVPDHIMGLFKDHKSFYQHLFAPASQHGFKSIDEYNETLATARQLQQRPYQVKFIHGDIKAHNILVNDKGHLAGFLDWESGGWYPEYWEFPTAMRFGRDSWWYQVAMWMGGHEYREELESDRALNLLQGYEMAYMAKLVVYWNKRSK